MCDLRALFPISTFSWGRGRRLLSNQLDLFLLSLSMRLSLFLPEQLWPEDQDQTSPHELPRNCHHRLCVGLRPVGPH